MNCKVTSSTSSTHPDTYSLFRSAGVRENVYVYNCSYKFKFNFQMCLISSSFCWEKSWILSWSVTHWSSLYFRLYFSQSKSKFSPRSRTTQTPNPFLDDDECYVGLSQDFWLHYSLISCRRLTDIFISKNYNIEPDLWLKWISQNVNWESVDSLKWRDVSVWKWSRRT